MIVRRAVIFIAFSAAAAFGAGAASAVDEAEDAGTVSQAQQVRVEVKVLEWQLNNTLDYDFAVAYDRQSPGSVLDAAQLNLPASPPLSNAARVFFTDLDEGSGSFDAVIETLESVGEISVLSEPTVIVPVGMDPPKNPEEWFQGRVSSGSSIPYESVAAFGGTFLASTTQYRQTGVILECSAREIKYDEFINLKVKVAITDLTGFINIGANANNEPLRAPVLDNRDIEAEVVVRDRSVFIAGLLKASREIERRQGIPWLSELPILRIFLSNYKSDIETTELVFLVRPEILAPLHGAL